MAWYGMVGLGKVWQGRVWGLVWGMVWGMYGVCMGMGMGMSMEKGMVWYMGMGMV